MDSFRQTPRERIERIYGASRAILFSEDAELIQQVDQVLSTLKVDVQHRTRLTGDELSDGGDRVAILLDMRLGEKRCWTIFDHLYNQDRLVGSRTLVLTRKAIASRLLIKLMQYDIRTYLPRDQVAELLKHRWRMMWDQAILRRRSERLGISVPVQFFTEGLFQAGTCTSFSEGGMFVTTPKLPPVQSIVTASMEIPLNNQKHELSGRVLYHSAVKERPRSHGFGMGFTVQVPALVEMLRPIASQA